MLVVTIVGFVVVVACTYGLAWPSFEWVPFDIPVVVVVSFEKMQMMLQHVC